LSATAYRESLTLFAEAARLAAENARPDLEARAHLGAAGALVWTAGAKDDIELVVRETGEAERLFRETGDAGGEIESALLGLEALWAAGEVEQLLARGRVLLERTRAIGDPVRELFVCGRLGPACLIGGYPEEAAEYDARTTALVAQLGARRPPWSRVGQCGRLRVIGDTDAALRCYSGFEEIARREQDPMYLMSYYRNIAEIMAMEQRRYAEAASFAERGVDLSVRLGEWWNRTEMTGTLAVTAAGRGDIARADQLIAEATKKKVGDVFADAYVAHCAARIHELAGRTAEADAAYRAATARYDTTGFRRGFFVSIAFLDHARLLHELGRDAEAAALLGEAEARLGTQQGGRADLVAKLRADIVRATSRR
jgi:hypothetical protein